METLSRYKVKRRRLSPTDVLVGTRPAGLSPSTVSNAGNGLSYVESHRKQLCSGFLLALKYNRHETEARREKVAADLKYISIVSFDKESVCLSYWETEQS